MTGFVLREGLARWIMINHHIMSLILDISMPTTKIECGVHVDDNNYPNGANAVLSDSGPLSAAQVSTSEYAVSYKLVCKFAKAISHPHCRRIECSQTSHNLTKIWSRLLHSCIHRLSNFCTGDSRNSQNNLVLQANVFLMLIPSRKCS